MATEILGKKLIGKKTTVGTVATRIPSTGSAPGTDAAEKGRQSIDIRNNGSNTVFLGDSTVTTASGYPLKAGESKPFDAADKFVIYGRTSTGTSDVRTLEGV